MGKTNLAVVSVGIPEEILERLDSLAQRDELPRSVIIRQSIKLGLDTREKYPPLFQEE